MKTRNLIVSAFMLCSIFTLGAQVTEAEKNLKTLETDTLIGWRFGGVTTVNLAQTALINWAAGGENSFAVNGLFSSFANYKSEKNVWDNSLDVGYGLLNQGDAGFRKTDDKIDFLSKYGRKAFTDFYYTALVNFKTQFSPGYNYPNDSVKISNFLAPAYVLAALGLNYQPNNYFNAFIAPLTGKLTIINDDALSAAGAYGVEPGEKSKREFGGYARIIYSRNDFKAELLKNVSFTTKIDLFSNYLKDPQNIDVSWENLIAMKVNKYISVSINTHLVYDADVKFDTDNDGIADKAKVQFKEILGLGISYNF
jgi:hypothetical protein